MGSYLLIVPSNAHEGRDEEYNDWYDTQHLKDVCAIPGVKSGRRFTSHPASPHPAQATYLTIYEIETDDPTLVIAELGRRASTGEMAISPALDVSSAQMLLFEARRPPSSSM